MEISKNEIKACDSELDKSYDGNDSNRVWFGRTLTFLRITSENKGVNQVGGTFDCLSDDENELVDLQRYFLQWYDVMGDEILTIDKIGKMLIYLRLRWTRTLGNTDFSASHVYGLITVGGSVERALMVRRDWVIHPLYNGKKRKVDYDNHCNSNNG